MWYPNRFESWKLQWWSISCSTKWSFVWLIDWLDETLCIILNLCTTTSLSNEIWTGILFCCAWFTSVYVLSYQLIHMIDLPISFKVASLALGQSYDCPSAREVTLNAMGKEANYLTMKKIQQNANQLILHHSQLYDLNHWLYWYHMRQRHLTRSFSSQNANNEENEFMGFSHHESRPKTHP